MDELVDIKPNSLVSSTVPNDIVLDYSKYSGDLDDIEISEEQKRELLGTLWSIMRLFVEFGFSIDVSGRATMDIFNHAARGDLKGEA